MYTHKFPICVCTGLVWLVFIRAHAQKRDLLTHKFIHTSWLKQALTAQIQIPSKFSPDISATSIWHRSLETESYGSKCMYILLHTFNMRHKICATILNITYTQCVELIAMGHVTESPILHSLCIQNSRSDQCSLGVQGIQDCNHCGAHSTLILRPLSNYCCSV